MHNTTFGIIAHNFTTRGAVDLMERREALIQLIKEENKHVVPEVNITYVGWPKKAKRHLASPEVQ